jgi:hypothetical protein
LGASPVYAQGAGGGCAADVQGVMTIASIGCIIQNLLKLIGPLVVLFAIFMIIFAGAKIILGGEDPKQYASGMQTLLYAVVGILLLGFIWFILVAIQQFTGANVTDFQFGR